MSLIQEALRRKQEEADASEEKRSPEAHSTQGSRPPSPPPPPDDDNDQAGDDAPSAVRTRTWFSLLGLILLLLLLLGGGAGAVLYALKELNEKTAVEVRNLAALEAEETPRTDREAPAVIAPSPAETIPEVAAAADQQDELPLSQSSPALASEAATPAPAPLAPLPVLNGGSNAPTAKSASGQVKKPVVWPRIVLSGLAGGSRSGSAILNNQIIGIGESIEGVTVKSITSEGVMLEFEGQRQVLRVGNSTRSAKP